MRKIFSFMGKTPSLRANILVLGEKITKLWAKNLNLWAKNKYLRAKF
jgi:hypothetical protein